MDTQLREFVDDLAELRKSSGQTFRSLSDFTGHGLKTLLQVLHGENMQRYFVLAIVDACGCTGKQRQEWDGRLHQVLYPDLPRSEELQELVKFQTQLHSHVAKSRYTYRELSQLAGLPASRVSMMLGDIALCTVEELVAVVRALELDETYWSSKWSDIEKKVGLYREFDPKAELRLTIPGSEILKLADGGLLKITVTVERL